MFQMRDLCVIPKTSLLSDRREKEFKNPGRTSVWKDRCCCHQGNSQLVSMTQCRRREVQVNSEVLTMISSKRIFFH